MRNKIGELHDTRNLTQAQIEDIKSRIKGMLFIKTIEITKGVGSFYIVTTDDNNIIDFSIGTDDKISLVKWFDINDAGKEVDGGATLTSSKIKAAE